MKPTFDNYVLIEQIRSIEAYDDNQINDISIIDTDESLSFDERLLSRAKLIRERYELSTKLNRARKYAQRSRGLLYVLALLLGAMGTAYAVTGTQTVNIYWLLLVLLGFNTVSMLLWLIGYLFSATALLSSWFVWIPKLIKKRISNNTTEESAADHAWLNCHYRGRVGKWGLSQITHEFWLIYLLGGLLILFIQLMTRQYDFVWGTTLLKDEVFVSLTAWMGQPLQIIGLAIPTAEQVWETRIGQGISLTAEHRFNWAQFLIGSIIIYGVLPRLLLWLWSISLKKLAMRQFQLDYYLPYYISLQQQVMSSSSHAEIIDADEHPPRGADSLDKLPQSSVVPESAYWVAVELGNDIRWPAAHISSDYNMGIITDQNSQKHITQQLITAKAPILAVAVSAMRIPDRGVKRIIAALCQQTPQCWLVLMISKAEPNVKPQRLTAWYQLAKDCAIAANHVVMKSDT